MGLKQEEGYELLNLIHYEVVTTYPILPTLDIIS